MANYLADKSYLAVKPQVAATTPIIPATFIPLVSESIRLNPNYAADRRIKGLDWKSDELLKGTRKIEGDITVWADPDAIGHLINMTYLKGTTTGDAAAGYTHPFTAGEGKSYSIELSRGAYAQRIWGARAENLKIEFQDNKMQAVVSIKALGQFYSASLAVATTGATTTLILSTDSDLRPTDGLVAGDILLVLGDNGTEVPCTIAVAGVNANGTTLTITSATITAAVGQPAHLKAQTPSYATLREPLYFGNTLIGVAATSALADTAAATKATATPCYNITGNFKNNLLDSPATGSTGPAVLLNQVREADLELSQLFTSPTQFQKWIEYVKQAITVIATGRYIKTDLSTSEKLTIKYHKIKLLTNEEPLDVGQYIFNKQKFEVLYDSADAKAIEISVINKTIGTDY
jgi:hypothetical protein